MQLKATTSKSLFALCVPALFALLAGATLTAWQSYTSYQERLSQSIEAFRSESLGNSLQAEMLLGSLDLAIESVRHAIVDNGTVTADEAELGRLSRPFGNIRSALPNLRTIVVVDSDGIIREDLRPEKPGLGIDVSDRVYFTVHADSQHDGLFIGDPVVSRVDGQLTFPMSEAVRSPSGELIAVVVSSVDAGFFSVFGQNQSDGPGRSVFLMHPDLGILTYLAPGPIDSERRDLLQGLYRSAPGAASTSLGTDVFHRGDLLATVVPIVGWPQSLLVTAEFPEIKQAALREGAWGTAVGLVLTFAVAGFLGLNAYALHAARRQTRVIAQLKDRLSFATQNAEIGIWDYEVATDELIWDDQMYRLYGRDRKSGPLSYEDWRQSLVPEDPARESRRYLAPREGDRVHLRFRIKRGDGAVRWLQSVALIEEDDSGKPQHMLGVNFDVTAEVEAAQALQAERDRAVEAEGKTRQLFAHVPHGTIVTDCDGKIESFNSHASSVFGLPPANAIGSNIAACVETDGFSDHLTALGDSKTEEVVLRTLEMQGVRADGGRFPALVSASRLDLGDERLIVWSIDDDTEKRAMEEQLRQAQRMEAVGQLTGGVAHDFNNILVTLAGSAELLEDIVSDRPDAMSLLRTLNRSVDRASALTSRLLAFSRQQPMQPKPTRVEELVDGLRELLVRSLGETVAFKTAIADGLWPAEIDENQFENAILNLALNARDAMPRGGTLMIEAQNVEIDDDYAATEPDLTPGAYVLVTVSDTGTGMPEDVRKRIFEPFFTTKEVGRGSGLGLSMVYGFAKQSGGHVTVYSELDHGTAFRLYLPRSNAEPEAKQEKEDRGDAVATAGRILIVEDNEDVRQVPVRILRMAGYEVAECTAADEALERLSGEAPYDLLFSDVVLPGDLNGLDLAGEAREKHPEIGILLTTGYTQNILAEHPGFSTQMELLTKPYRRNELLERVEKLLQRA